MDSLVQRSVRVPTKFRGSKRVKAVQAAARLGWSLESMIGGGLACVKRRRVEDGETAAIEESLERAECELRRAWMAA